MKLNFLKPAALAVTMALAACTTTKVIEVPANQNGLTLGQGEDVIHIALSNTTDTRAARPMGSSEPDNNVNRIGFKFLATDGAEVKGITLSGVIDKENGKAIEGYDSDNTDGMVLKLPQNYNGGEICVKFEGLTKGSYRIIAYGYNYTDETDERDAFPYPISLKGSDFQLQCDGVTDVQEIFAGYSKVDEEGDGSYSDKAFVSVNQHGKFNAPPKITLERQVAGLMAYFKNAPAYVNNTKVEKITVSSKAKVTSFSFPASLLGNPEYNGVRTDDWQAESRPEDEKWVHYLTFQMSSASNYASAKQGDYYKFQKEEGKFLQAEEMKPIENLTCDEDTLFGSRFLLAYPDTYDCNTNAPECATLNICYWGANDQFILCVPLRNGGPEKPLDHSEQYQYHILCNNFYSIGTKTVLDVEDAGTDQNNPLDIDESTGYEYAEVDISDDWSASHSLLN